MSRLSLGFATQDWSFATDPPTLGGAGHYRIGLPAAALAEAGYDVAVGALIGARIGKERHPALGVLPVGLMDADREAQLAAATWPDVLVMQRVMMADVAGHVHEARLAGQTVVQDIDDWFGGLPPSNRAFHTTHARANPEVNREHYFAVLAASDLVIASTPYLAERVRGRCGAPTVVIRNAIDLERWSPHPQQQPPTLGWVGALSHRARDLEQLRGLAHQVVGHGYAAHFHHSGRQPGTEPACSRLGLRPDELESEPMAPITTYPHLFDAIDVGIAPLEDVPFNRAKSCIKGMEFAASGVPFVASDIDEYRWLAEEHGIGRVARRPRDWLRHLRELAELEVREAEALEQRRRLEALDIARRWPEWLEVLESAAAGSTRA